MPCGCFGGGSGVGKAEPGDKYKPKDNTSLNKPLSASPITTKPAPVLVDPIPSPVKAPVHTSAAPPPTKGGSSPGSDAATRGQPGDDPDKANRRRDVVASYYSDECELLAYKTTDSRPTSQVDGGSPPVATSSPTPSSPASTRSAASTRADLAEKRREFFKPLVGSEQDHTGNKSLTQHSHALLEEHERQLEYYKEPTVKDVVHKFEHLPEDLQASSKRETEVRLGRNSSSTTVTVLHSDKQNHKQPGGNHMVSHIDNELTPEQQKQEQQLVNKAALHNQLLSNGQVNLRPTPPKPKVEPMPDMTFTGPDQPHDDNCIVQTTPAVTPTPDDTVPTPAKPPPKPAHLPPEHHVQDHMLHHSPISEPPTPFITEPKTLPAETEPLLSETEPLLSETEPLLSENEPVLSEIEPLLKETEPRLSETEPVTEPQHIYTIPEPEPVVTEPQHVDIPEHAAQPEPVVKFTPVVVETETKNVTEHESEIFTEFKNVEEPIFSLEKTAPVLESESDVTEAFSCEIKPTRDSESNDTTALAAVTEPMFDDREDAFITQETELISVLEENKKNIISSQSEQLPFESHSEIKTEVIHSDPSSIIESKSVITKNQEIVSQMENVLHGSPQECFDLSETTSNEESISISKTEPIDIDHMMMDLATDISQSKHLTNVNSSDEDTTHTETSKSIVTDEDGNTIIHTETVTTKTFSSSEIIPETLTTEPSDHVIKPIAEMNYDDQQEKSHIQSNLNSSLPPVTQIGSSPSPSSSSPRNSSHSSPASSPPASPDSLRTHKIDKVELQYEQDSLAHQINQEVEESCPALSADHSNPKEDTMHTETNKSIVTDEDGNTIIHTETVTTKTFSSSTLNNQDAPKVHNLIDENLATGLPSLCNEADVTAPASLEDDGLGSEIDDALDSTDCFSEEGSSHNHQPHHQPVPAPPPPSSAS